jgi:anti-sigma factor RsiW
MNCSEVRKLIPLFAGGDLEPDESGRIEEHLASCKECSSFLDAFRADRELLGSLREKGPGPPVFGEFWSGLRRKLEPEVRRHRNRVFAHRVLRAVTAAAVLLIVVTFLVSFEEESPVRPPQPSKVELMGTLHEMVEPEKKQQGLELEECELCVDPARQYDF